MSRPCRPISRPPSRPPTRATAASRPALSRCCGRSIGSTATGAFPAKSASSDARAIVRVEARTELKDRSRFDVRSYITSSARSAAQLAQTIRGHWGIENTLHWTLDVTFQEDLSRLRKGHGAQNMALVRKFAFNKLKTAPHSATRRASPSNPADAQPSRQDPRASSSDEKSRAGTSIGSSKSSWANQAKLN